MDADFENKQNIPRFIDENVIIIDLLIVFQICNLFI